MFEHAARLATITALAVSTAFGCSAAKQGEPTGGSSTGGTSGAGGTSSTTGQGGATTSSAGGATGSGGVTTSTGGAGGAGASGGSTTGGSGGMTTSSTSSSSSSSSTTTLPTQRVLVFAGGGASMIAAHFDEGIGWIVASINAVPGASPAVAMADVNQGVALFPLAADNHLFYSTWDGASYSAPLSIGMLATTAGGASMVRGDGAFQAGYWGADGKHYFAKYAGLGGGWSPVAEAVMPPGGGQSFGASAPSVAAIGADLHLVHAGSDGKVYEQARSGGQWSAATGHDVGGVQNTITPSVIALSGDTEDLMIVHVVSANSQIGWITRKPGNPPTWSAAALIPNALTQDRIALAPLPNGGAVMAFRGLNTNVYTSIYTPGANPPWSAPSQLANPNYSTPSSPALAAGIGAAAAELVFADGATGKALHARLTGQTWSAPVEIGGAGVTLVGMASVQ